MSHAIIDGIIDIPRTKQWVLPYEDAKLSPDSVSLKIDLTCFNLYTDWIRLRIRIGICILSHGLPLRSSWI